MPSSSSTDTSFGDDKTQYRKDIFTKKPPQLLENKPGQLTDEQLSRFFDQGYLVLHDFFPTEQLDACRKDIEELVDKLANDLYAAGKIKNLYKDHGLLTRLTHISEEFPGANIILHKIGKVPTAFKNIWTDEKLLNIVEQIIGPDIMGHPVWNLRTKTPLNEATVVPWHQDCAYLDDDAMDVFQLTAWIPFVDANEINGTLQVAEKAHKHGKVAEHVCCYRGTWYVEMMEDVLASELEVDLNKDIKTCDIKYGGLILFSNMLPHRSLPNLSNIIRWSCDLRWQTPHKKVGFYGLKEGILFRSKDNPNITPNWDKFDSYDRNRIQNEQMNQTDAVVDPFDTTIMGPWMKKWKIVNANRHTTSYLEDSSSWTKA